MTAKTMTAQTPDFEILSERLVLHRVSTRGVVVGKVQRCRLGTHVADVRWWYDWSNPKHVHHIDSVPVGEV